MRSLGSRDLGAQTEIGSCLSRDRSRLRWPDRCMKFFLPVSPSTLQCLPNGTNDGLAHAVGITKTYFAFCWMHIYVHCAGIELKKQERNRVLAFHESRVIAFAHGPGDKTAFDRPAVYEH